MEAFIHLITSFGVLAILFVVFAETGLLIGFLFPGDSLLFTSGFLVQEGILPIDINLFVLLLFIAGVLGESTGYLIGRRLGQLAMQKIMHTPHGKHTRIFGNEPGILSHSCSPDRYPWWPHSHPVLFSADRAPG